MYRFLGGPYCVIFRTQARIPLEWFIHPMFWRRPFPSVNERNVNAHFPFSAIEGAPFSTTYPRRSAYLSSGDFFIASIFLYLRNLQELSTWRKPRNTARRKATIENKHEGLDAWASTCEEAFSKRWQRWARQDLTWLQNKKARARFMFINSGPSVGCRWGNFVWSILHTKTWPVSQYHGLL